MKHTASIAVLSLLVACGEKSSEGGGLGSSAPQSGSEAPDGSAGEGMTGKSVVATLDESVEYMDGGTARKLWISKELVAEFFPSDSGRDAILAADPGAVEVEQPQPVVRIWKLAGGRRGEEFAQAVWNPALPVSPVLHEGPSEKFPMRALGGGVIVTFKPDWDRARIDAWLARMSLSVKGDPVSPEANMYLVGTAPGLGSLAVAAELLRTGEFVDVVPNFWRQNEAK